MADVSTECSEAKNEDREIDLSHNQKNLIWMLFIGYYLTEIAVFELLVLLSVFSSDLLLPLSALSVVAIIAWWIIPGQNGFLGLWDTGIECWTTLFWQQVVLSALSGWLSLIALFLLHLPFFVMNEDVSISDTFFREWLYSNFHIMLTLVLLCVLKYKGLFSEKASRESFVYFMFIFGFRTFFVLSRSLF